MSDRSLIKSMEMRSGENNTGSEGESIGVLLCWEISLCYEASDPRRREEEGRNRLLFGRKLEMNFKLNISTTH